MKIKLDEKAKMPTRYSTKDVFRTREEAEQALKERLNK